MNLIENVRQKLTSMSYNWTSPATYAVFVPGLSLVIQKVQMQALLPLMTVKIQNVTRVDEETQQNTSAANAQVEKFIRVTQWHLRGTILQVLILSVAILKIGKFRPLILAMGILATYELLNTAYKAFKTHVTIYEFLPTNKKRMVSITNATVFNLLYTPLWVKGMGILPAPFTPPA